MLTLHSQDDGGEARDVVVLGNGLEAVAVDLPCRDAVLFQLLTHFQDIVCHAPTVAAPRRVKLQRATVQGSFLDRRNIISKHQEG